ncbi:MULTISPECIES: PucR family transcriptional regulator [unclassified Rathayibacter]|uniref:PucR family transcriptional regulator n=1 Tax=unclassified Rathayibacter TaxID=2609250 RepID=UPI0006F74F95|nr:MULTISPECIES: PucR family transcriptional regulator [unclassified Rathayibacter]KQQ06229.1 hypothetical protein ASF42_06875 [Rathayibacter sp. Leaf294]KQS14084.1 hypothetical protein ASG06_06875 [Rathayibacter sp. Leaf185]
MPVTIADICALPDLALDLVAGRGGVGREIRWVHVSEVVDPTPWLQGGELLLVTGLRLEPGVDLRDYVRRLSDAGLAGIGFGVGFGFDDVPGEMVAEADRTGIPLLRVPVDTPYMAISEAVSSVVSADRYEAIGRALAAQQDLTRAALGAGSDFVKELSRHLGGWVAQTTVAGEVVHAWPPQAAERVPELLADLARAREHGGPSAASILTPGTSTVVQPLALGGTLRGFLLAGLDRALGAYERSVLTAAISLLTLELERAGRLADRLYRQRARVLERVLASDELSSDALAQFAAWGLADAAVRVCVILVAEEDADARLEEVILLLASSEATAAAALTRYAEGPAIVVAFTEDADILTALRGMAATSAGTALGIGDALQLGDLLRNHRAARHAALLGRADGRAVTEFAEFAALQMLLRSTAPSALRGFVSKTLGPLTRGGGREHDLRRTLEVFLAANGRWGEAAQELGVHRHTLRARMDRVAEATGRDPDAAYARMELWLALLIEDSIGLDS